MTMPDFSWIDLGSWGLFDLILFILIAILVVVLAFVFLGMLIRRLSDLILPSARKRMTEISEDQLEREKELNEFGEPFYIEDGILDRNPREFLEEKGVENYEMSLMLEDANKKLEDIAIKETEFRNEESLIVKEYENNIFEKTDLTPEELERIVDEKLGPVRGEESDESEDSANL